MSELRRWWWPVGHAVAAVGCAAVALLATGPSPAAAIPRFIAGVLLALYLPGRLAVRALLPGRAGLLGHVLTAPLSLVTCATVGLTLAGTHRGFRPPLAVAGLLAACLILAGIALVRGHRLADRRGVAGGFGVGPVRPLRPRPYWIMALPALALTVLLVDQLVAATRYRSADSYYTEFAADRTGIVVHSRERGPVRFRYEARQGDVVLQSAEFTLRPGERTRFALPSAGSIRVEARLYRASGSSPYRTLIL